MTGIASHGLSSLRTQIMKLRIHIHATDRFFIPQRALFELLTRARVHDAISACTVVETFHIQEVVNFILAGAVKVFAILVLLKGEEALILRFVESDLFQKNATDSRLPFHHEHIKTLLPEDVADDFYQKQWEFCSPFFSKAIIHRIMPPSTRLPFILDANTGKEGGFGRIYEIQLHPEYHDASFLQTIFGHSRLVRKEFLPNPLKFGTFEQEMHNLSILNHIRHPNIIEMLGSYTFAGKYNAIFPLAVGGDLADFMTQVQRPAQFTEDIDICKALSELSSALEAIHNYTANDLNLTLIGIHHDLKPQNILVHENKFILSDFGLARFRSSDETSKSLFKVGAGHYLAPECEGYEEAFQKYTVSRPSDIWAFGCILAEMATYMVHGSVGVTDFRTARKVQLAGFTTYTFHAGVNEPNPRVVDWLDQLHKQNSVSQLIDLIKSMLSVDPDLRPACAAVTVELYRITTMAYIHHVQLKLASLSNKNCSHELETQHHLFEAWAETVSLEIKEAVISRDSVAHVHMVINLQEMRREVEHLEFRLEKATSPLLLNLRDINQKLLDLLPVELRKQAHSRFQLWVMQDHDISAEVALDHPDDHHSQASRKLSMLATMCRITRQISGENSDKASEYILTADRIEILEALEDYLLGSYQAAPLLPARSVLVEQVRYDTYWEGSVGQEMLERMGAITKLLHSLSAPGALPILPCIGFYHIPARFSFGFVFQYPLTRPSNNVTQPVLIPSSLNHVINDTRNARHRPSLNDRFHVAKILVTALLDFHKAGWLHKSISGHNVIFFHQPSSSSATWLERPYITGFNRSRQDQNTAFTEGLTVSDKHLSYLHQRYLKGDCRFQRSFDYYSLGLVLLEIGLWKNLDSILIDLSTHPSGNGEDILGLLMNKRVPLLKHAMGTTYCCAVQQCLSWDTTHNQVSGVDEWDLSEEQRTKWLLEFERLVVEPIQKTSL